VEDFLHVRVSRKGCIFHKKWIDLFMLTINAGKVQRYLQTLQLRAAHAHHRQFSLSAWSSQTGAPALTYRKLPSASQNDQQQQ
jgi:hypothetical protein